MASPRNKEQAETRKPKTRRLYGGLCELTALGSEFHRRIFNSQPHIAVGSGETANGFGLVDSGFEHDQRYRYAAACGLDDVNSRVTVDMAGPHQDADTTLYQLRVLHVHVDHEVFVHVAESRHGPGGDHV